MTAHQTIEAPATTETLTGAEIVVRAGQVSAQTGEAEHLIALDGKTYAASPTDCVIADAGGERPIGLGGVMGGLSTGCSDETTDVFVESAWFEPIAIAQTGRLHGIHSDAQYRFARGVDPGGVALERGRGGIEELSRLMVLTLVPTIVEFVLVLGVNRGRELDALLLAVGAVAAGALEGGLPRRDGLGVVVVPVR